MAEPIGTASGLVALAVFSFNASVTLYQTVHSFRSTKRQVRDLQAELEALQEALKPLAENFEQDLSNLESLKLPLLRCGHACNEFDKVISKCVEHSTEARTSFRDWAKLQYMGSDIDGFKHIIAGYKATINIALGSLTLRKATVTADALASFERLIANTTEDLHDHLDSISAQLQTVRAQNANRSNGDAINEAQIVEENDSTRMCLEICAQVSEQLDRVRPLLVERRLVRNDRYDASVYVTDMPTTSKELTAQFIDSLRERTNTAVQGLEGRLRSLEYRLARAASANTSSLPAPEATHIEEEIGSIRRCLEICDDASAQASQARTNIFEDVRAGDDASQVLVSTLGDLVSARRVIAGARSLQVMGQMKDETLQQFQRPEKVPSETTQTGAGADAEMDA